MPRASAARCSSSTATDDHIIAVERGARGRRADRRASWSRSRARPRAARRATRCRSTCCCATSPSASRPAAAPRARGRARATRPQARAVRLVADRPRPRVARRRDRRRAAPPACPGLEIDWLAQEPVTTVLDARGETIHPASARARQRVRAHRPRGRRARPARVPGDAPDGRDPLRELHGLPRRRARGARTTCGSATRPGSSTTSCTRTPS